MVGVRQQKAAETRGRLLAAARRLFTDPGYFAVGTQELVAAAGVGTRGALYHHFADKQDLFRAVFVELETELTGQGGRSVRGATAFEQLRHALLGYLDVCTDPAIRQIILIDGPAVLGWSEWRDREREHGQAGIASLLVQGRRDGSIAVKDEQVLAHLLLSFVNEAALLIAHADHPTAVRKAARAAVSSLLSGIAGR